MLIVGFVVQILPPGFPVGFSWGIEALQCCLIPEVRNGGEFTALFQGGRGLRAHRGA